jgi:hypothetical protein
MQYVLLIYQGTTPIPSTPEWAALPQEEQKRRYAESAAERVQDGTTLTTDGPFVEPKEAIGGYYLLEADDLDAAIELASRIPAARLGGAVEIRPSAKYW